MQPSDITPLMINSLEEREKIHSIQIKLQQDADELLRPNVQQNSGEFSSVYQFNHKLAIKWHKKSGSSGELQKELTLLNYLHTQGISVVQTYGDVFQIKGRDALIMDWIEDAVLVEAKRPNNYLTLLSVLLELKIPAGESWAMHLDTVKKDIKNKISAASFNLEQLHETAINLHTHLLQIDENLKKNNLAIGDLQILITPNGKAFIIDPLDVLKVNHQANNTNFQNIDDLVSKTNFEINKEYAQIIQSGIDMLSELSIQAKIFSTINRKNLLDHIMKLIEPDSAIKKKSLIEAQAGALTKKYVAHLLLNRVHKARPSPFKQTQNHIPSEIPSEDSKKNKKFTRK